MKAHGAQAAVSAAVARTLHVFPAGSGPVLSGVDRVVVVERRAIVTSVGVNEGEWVQRGQQLLEVSTIGQSAAVATAVNQLWVDQKRLPGVRAKDGALAATTLALLNQIAQDRQQLADLKSTPTVVTAPVAGRVSGLSITAGAALDRSDVLLHVVDDRTVRVVVPVAANYRAQLAVGQSAVMTLRSQPGATYTATVAAIGPTAHADPGAEDAVPVTVTVPNAAHLLVLGTSAYVRFSIDRHASVAVDAIAVLGVQQQPFVFTVDHGRVRQQAVVVGVSDGSWTEIISGVAAGEDVVISGGQRLVDGAAVHVSRAGAP
jgi:membrane fusion protein (multidrug efflux system)